jgi:hypothetical protein
MGWSDSISGRTLSGWTSGRHWRSVRVALLGLMLVVYPVAWQSAQAQAYLGPPVADDQSTAAPDPNGPGGTVGGGRQVTTDTMPATEDVVDGEGVQAVPIGSEMSLEELQRLKQQAEAAPTPPPPTPSPSETEG